MYVENKILCIKAHLLVIRAWACTTYMNQGQHNTYVIVPAARPDWNGLMVFGPTAKFTSCNPFGRLTGRRTVTAMGSELKYNCFLHTRVLAACCGSFPTLVVAHHTIQQWARIFKRSNHGPVHWDPNNAEEPNLLAHTSLMSLRPNAIRRMKASTGCA